MSERTTVEVDGRQLTLSNLGKVLYPQVGFTKGQVIDYYARIAEVMLPHLAGRGITLRRYPDGVDGESFFEKRCPSHRPPWVETVPGPGDARHPVRYCLIADRPSLVWSANLAALELHAPMARAAEPDQPTMVVFDLDPGAPAGQEACARVALDIAEVLAGLDLRSYPKTSGAKGLQLYLPLDPGHTHDQAASFARAVAQLLERRQPARVTSTMARAARPGKVFVDWSQNSFHKTTVAPYSLRARPRPTVSTPLRWGEVEAIATGEPFALEAPAVLDRVAQVGDLFAPTLREHQVLPERGG